MVPPARDMIGDDHPQRPDIVPGGSDDEQRRVDIETEPGRDPRQALRGGIGIIEEACDEARMHRILFRAHPSALGGIGLLDLRDVFVDGG
jgi:hypothetical protein